MIDRIFASDALIIGSPIYLGDVTSQVHGLIERLHFCALSYDDYSNYFTGKVNGGIILTMNAPKAYYMLSQGFVGASFRIQRAIEMRCCSPPDKLAPPSPITVSNPCGSAMIKS